VNSKLRNLDELPSLLAGKRVVLANGSFDIVHVGHVRCLEGARKLGDALVVAINSDRTVAELKGPGRPILTEAERVALVSALRCVDYVVVFNELDLAHVLKILRPAVHAKGTD
jgi:D-glycero-beta-D-manno-heptose 1-phosphate adenylyltransferase